jgi:uroporphyrinogen decarboxylase
MPTTCQTLLLAGSFFLSLSERRSGMKLHKRTPDFSNLAAVLERKVPDRPTLFEFFMNGRLYDKLVDHLPNAKQKGEFYYLTQAYASAGYDYVILHPSAFNFPFKQREKGQTISLNDATILTKDDFDAYRKAFVSPKQYDLSAFEEMQRDPPRL